jgi:RNA polymerase sigma factor (sigma-70 family)
LNENDYDNLSSLGKLRGAALDSAALRAAAGDRQAEQAAIASVIPLLKKIIGCRLGRNKSLMDRSFNDVLQDALCAAIKATRKYDGRCRYTSFVGSSVELWLRDGFRRYAIPSGAHVPRNLRFREIPAALFKATASVDGWKDASGGERALPELLDFRGAERVEQAEAAEDRHGRVIRLLSCLTPREVEVIARRFWNEETLEEVAASMGGLSRERIRQIQNRAMGKIRAKVEAARAAEAG